MRCTERTHALLRFKNGTSHNRNNGKVIARTRHHRSLTQRELARPGRRLRLFKGPAPPSPEGGPFLFPGNPHALGVVTANASRGFSGVTAGTLVSTYPAAGPSVTTGASPFVLQISLASVELSGLRYRGFLVTGPCSRTPKQWSVAERLPIEERDAGGGHHAINREPFLPGTRARHRCCRWRAFHL